MKRKPRKMTKGIDFLKPINIEDFGGPDDPCFGKFNDPKAAECMRCGDCELCAVAQAQNMHKKRAKIESKQKFKDLEPIIPKEDIKSVRNKIKKYLKVYPNTFISNLDILNSLTTEGISQELILKAIPTLPKKFPDSYKLNKDKTKIKWIN
jgi:hypothetical protein